MTKIQIIWSMEILYATAMGIIEHARCASQGVREHLHVGHDVAVGDAIG